MGKKILVILCIIVIMAGIGAAVWFGVIKNRNNTPSGGNQGNEQNNNPAGTDIPKPLSLKEVSKEDFEAILVRNVLEENSTLNDIIKNHVVISVIQVGKDSAKISVKAPDIYNQLVEYWEKAKAEFIDGDLTEKIKTFLSSSDSTETLYELKYVNNGDIEIIYESAYFNKISCGLFNFYNYLMQESLAEKEGNQ